MSIDQAEYIAQKCIELGRKTSGHLTIYVYLPRMATQNDILDILFYKKIILLSAAGDKTLLPGAIDYIMLHASAALAYERLEMFDEALRQWNLWKERLADAWRALDKNTTGEVITFSI